MACVEINRAEGKKRETNSQWLTSKALNGPMLLVACERENRIIMHRGDVKWHKNVVLLSLRRLVSFARRRRRRHKNGSSRGEARKSIDECFPFLASPSSHCFEPPTLNEDNHRREEGGVVEWRTWFRFSYLIFRNPIRLYLITNLKYIFCVFLKDDEVNLDNFLNDKDDEVQQSFLL